MKKENKNIERLFQEKFKDFEVSPPDFVWENIQEKLNPKEKKRRVIPFWFKTAGIAASFITIVSIVFYTTNNDFNKVNSSNNNSVVNSNTKKNNSNPNLENNKFNASDSNKNLNNTNSSFNDSVENNTASNSLVNNGNSNSGTNFKSNKSTLENVSSSKSNTSYVLNPKKQFYRDAVNNDKKLKSSSNSNNSEIVSNKNYKNKFRNNKIQSNSKFNGFKSNLNQSSSFGITDLNSTKKFKSYKNKKSNAGIIDFDSNMDFNSNIGITDSNSISNFNTSKNKNSTTNFIDINKLNSTTIPSNNNGVAVENPTENLNNAITTVVAIEDTKADTIALAIATIEENPLEKLLREKETKKVVDEKEKSSKWALNSYVSPIFFNSFASGSPISEEFATNEKKFNNSTSYGVGVAYNLNKRLSIKTGVSNLNLDYDTENIAFYSTFVDQSKIANTNIERNSNGKYLVLKHEKDDAKNAMETQMIQSNQNLGTLNQKTQYIEVPLEMSYAIVNKKFGVAIKGGMSTLFLTQNEVSIKAPDGNMQIGKASNLNEVHFSSNVGLGFSYIFMKNFQLNLEPTLKYQINTFNKNSEDFTPYVIGVNTGISYKF